MEDSPYKPPQPESFAEPQHVEDPAETAHQFEVRYKMRRVAKYQRLVIFSVLANLGYYVVVMALRDQPYPARFLIPAVGIPVVIFAITSIALLTKEVMNTIAAVLFAFLMFVPCVSLIVLLVVNQSATSYLQSNGVKVGFFGVNPNSI